MGRMYDASETKRLGEAINSLGSVIAEIVEERLRHLEEASNGEIRGLPATAADPALS